MSSANLDIFLRARDEASGAIREVESSAAGMKTQLAGSATGMRSVSHESAAMGEKLKHVAKIAVGFIGAVGIEQFAAHSLEAYDKLEKSQKRLALGLHAIGLSSKALDPLLAWTKSFSLQTGINQGDIVDMTSKLTTMGRAFFESAGPKANHYIESLVGGMTNLAAATGKSASMLMRSLGPSILNTPEKAVGLLQKYGVLTDEQVDKVKALAKAGHSQAASQMEINALQARYSGEAAKTATPLEKLRNLWNQLELAGGKLISGVLGWIYDHGPAILSWVKTFAIVLGPLIAAWTAYTVATKIAAAAQAIFNAVMDTNPIILIAAAVLLVAGLVIKNWGVIKRVTLEVWGAIKSFFVGIWNSMKGVVFAFWHVIRVPLMVYFTIWKTAFNVAKTVALAVWSVVRDVFKVAWGVITTVFKGLWTVWKTEFGIAKTIAVGIWNALKVAVKAIAAPVLFVIHSITNAIKTLVGWIKTAIGFLTGLAHHAVEVTGSGNLGIDFGNGGTGGGRGPKTAFGLGGAGASRSIVVRLDRKRFVGESEYEVTYRGW